MSAACHTYLVQKQLGKKLFATVSLTVSTPLRGSEFGWYSCPTCPPGGWDCSNFSLDDVAADTRSRGITASNRTLGCYSKYLIEKLNISANQLVNPATRAPLVPP